MPLACDLMYPSPTEEKKRHKLKRLVQNPNSYFMDVMCPRSGCFAIKVIFSHPSERKIKCDLCNTILCTSTGGKGHLTDGCRRRKKLHC